MTRSRRSAWTLAAGVVGGLSGSLLSVLSTPLLLRWLGDERVGAFRVVGEWGGYLALLDFGIGGALQVGLARAVGTGDRKAVAALVRAGARAGLWMALLSAVGSLALYAATPYLIRGLSEELVGELRLGILLGLVGLAWVPLIAVRPLVEADQRGYLVQAGLAVQAWTLTGLSLALAWAGAGLPGQFLAAALGNGICLAILARYALRRFPEILTAHPAAAALPAAFSGPMFLYNFLGRVGLLSDAIVIGYLLGPASVVVFVITQRLILLAHAQLAGLGSASWAALSELYHQGRLDQFNRRLVELTLISGVLACALLVPLAAATGPFVRLWVGADRYGGGQLTLATAAYVWVHTIVALWGWPLVTTGRVRRLLPVYLIGIPLNVAVSVGGVRWVGIAGPAIGSAASLAAVWLWWVPLLLRREFGTPLWPLARAVLAPAALALPLGACVGLLMAAWPPDELPLPIWARWAVLVAEVAAGAVCCLTVTGFLVVPKSLRMEIASLVLRR